MLLITYCCNLYIVLKVMIHVVTDKNAQNHFKCDCGLVCVLVLMQFVGGMCE